MLSMKRKNFPDIKQIVRSLSLERLEAAKVELEASRKTTVYCETIGDEGITDNLTKVG